MDFRSTIENLKATIAAGKDTAYQKALGVNKNAPPLPEGSVISEISPNVIGLPFGMQLTPEVRQQLKAYEDAGYTLQYREQPAPSGGGGFFNDFVNNPLGTVSNTVSNFVENPAKTLNDYWNSGGRDAAILAALTAAAVSTGGASLGAEGIGATGAFDAGLGLDAMSGGAGLVNAGTAAGANALAAETAANSAAGETLAGTAGMGAAAPVAAAPVAAAPVADPYALQTAGGALTSSAGGAINPYTAALPAAAAAAGAAGTASWMTPAAIVGSSLIGANAAQQAANTQANAAAQANQLLAQQYAQQRADLAPFTAAGVGAQNKLLTYLGLPGGTQGADYGKYAKDFTGADFLAGQDPGYAFRLSEGQKALERSAAARGGLLSGGTGKALTSYGQQMGSQEYQNAYNRYQTNRANQLAPLFTLTGSGQASAANQAAAAGNYAAGAGNNLTSAGAAQAAGNVGTANALTGGLNTYLGYTSQQDLLNAYNARTAAAKSAYS